MNWRCCARACLDSIQAAQLLEANEQLVQAALQARTDTTTILLAMDDLAQASQRTAQNELRAREAMARLYARLEDRVAERTRELELARDEAGQVEPELKTPCRDGTTHLVMSPLEFMQQMAALAPRPRLHLISFHGVLAPNAKLHPLVVPQGPAVEEQVTEAEVASERETETLQDQGRPYRISWARLLKQSGLYRAETASAAKRMQRQGCEVRNDGVVECHRIEGEFEWLSFARLVRMTVDTRTPVPHPSISSASHGPPAHTLNGCSRAGRLKSRMTLASLKRPIVLVRRRSALR
jgi:hypothetical protein